MSASTFTLTDAPEPIEPAGRVREVTVEGRTGGSQEIKKHEEHLERESRGDAANLTDTLSLPGQNPVGPGLTIAWILVGPGLWGADSMSWARCREP